MFKIVIPIQNIKANVNPISPELLGMKAFKDYLEANKDKLPIAYKYVLYLHYKYYPIPNDNPFYNIAEYKKDSTILKQIGLDEKALKGLKHKEQIEEIVIDIYTTPMIRLLNSYKKTIDKISKYLDEAVIDDKNIKNISSYLKEFDNIREIYKKTIKDVEQELQENPTINNRIAYDLKSKT